MAVTFKSTTNQYSLNTENNVLVLPFAAVVNDVIVVHVGIRSSIVGVASVTDDNNNVYTCKTSVLAIDESDYTTGGLSKNPIFHNAIAGEIWAVKSTGTVTKITVTLTDDTRFAVVVTSYLGGSAIGVSSSAKQVQTATPTVGLLTTAANSFVSASFHSAESLPQVASTGTLRNSIAATDDSKGVSTTAGDNTSVGLATCNVVLTPTVTTPITYACVALEIKA
jgi:hypothetical protein